MYKINHLNNEPPGNKYKNEGKISNKNNRNLNISVINVTIASNSVTIKLILIITFV